MNILVTGAKGFVGKNLVAALENIRDGKDRTRGSLPISTIFPTPSIPIPRFSTAFAATRISSSIWRG